MSTKAALAIRTVVVTTRAAVRANRAQGAHHKVDGSVQAGMALLDQLEDRFRADADATTRQLLEKARRELAAMLDRSAVGPGRTVAHDGAVPEQVDVGAELGSELAERKVTTGSDEGSGG